MTSQSSAQDMEESSSNEYAALLSVNEDCLLSICKYLNIKDIKNLASTCYALRNFIRSWSILPKLSKSIKLYLAKTSTVLDMNFCALSVNEVKAHILQVGNYVVHLSVMALHEDLISPDTWRHFEYILQKCPNLQRLCVTSFEFNEDSLNSVSTQLKELHLKNCLTSTEDWSEILRKFPDLEQLTIDGFHKINNGMLEHCQKLSHLAVNNIDPLFLTTELELISEASGQRIRTLKLLSLDGLDTDLILSLIRDKLPNLDCLAIVDLNLTWREIDFRLFEHKSLKILRIDVNDYCVNPFLRVLSTNGVIEVLSFQDGLFVSQNIETYTFNKLKTLQWRDGARSGAFIDFIKTFTLANMPELQYLYFNYEPFNAGTAYIEQDFVEIVKLVQTKKSLRVLSIGGRHTTFSLVRKMIDMLKANRSIERSCLNLDLFKLQTTDEEVNKCSLNI